MDRMFSRPGPLRAGLQAESAASPYGHGRPFVGRRPDEDGVSGAQGAYGARGDMGGMDDRAGDMFGAVGGQGSASAAHEDDCGAKGTHGESGSGTARPYCCVNEEEYRRGELTSKERDWFLSLACVDIADDLNSSVEALFRAPKSLRHSADYGFLGGLVVGRLLALDHFGKPHVKELLQKIYNLVEPWTVFSPGAAGFMLATFSPQVVYALILFWPEEYAPYRTFYTAALMGLYLERMPGTDFLHGEGADNLCAIIESQRREGSLGLL